MRLRNKLNVKAFCLCTVMAVTPVYATTTDVKADKDSIDLNQMANSSFVSSADSMDDWIENVREAYKLDTWGFKDGGKFFFHAVSPVSQSAMDPNFGTALAVGYERAWSQLQQDYVTQLAGRMNTEKTQEFYRDASTNAREFESDKAPKSEMGIFEKMTSLFSKSVDVAESKLDQQLIEMGTDPRDLEKMPVEEKKTLINDSFLRTSITEASDQISGLIPIRTKLIIDDAGNATVGVIGVASPKTRQLAKDIAMGRESLITGNHSGDLKDLLPNSDKAFVNEFGVRLVYETNGKPALLSYGVGSYVPDKSDNYLNGLNKKAAYDSASSFANAQLAEMVNGRMSLRSQQKIGDEITKFVKREVKAGALPMDQVAKNVINIQQRTVKASASINLQGVSDLKRWNWTSPEGVKFVGVVKKWSYDTLNTVRNFDKPVTSSNSNASTLKKPSGDTGYNVQSKSINKLDDF